MAAVDLASTSSARAHQRLGYLPALDGIRAIAILAVMSYHFGQGWIPGGFMGVDVFFVLSGFLITTLLVQRAPDRFSLGGFWERRIRRLMPALAVMLLMVSLFALGASSLEQATVRGQGIATVLYVSNWWLIATDQHYFDAFRAPSPLLQTWTLSVEEQWYLLFPLLLGLLMVIRRFTLRAVTGLCVVLAVASSVWTVVLAASGASADRLYLGTDTRAQQLLAGAVLATLGVAAVRRYGNRLGRLPAKLAGSVGLVGMMGLCAMFGLWPADRWVALQLPLAAVFAGGVIVAALTPNSVVARALSWEPLRLIGVISYGLYLWHWPIWVLVDQSDTSAAAAVSWIGSFLAAIASYFLVERPIRAGSGPAWWMLAVPILVVAVILSCTQQGARAAGLISSPPPASANPVYFGKGPKVFMVGDSLTWSLLEPLMKTPRKDLAVTASVLLGCPVFHQTFKPGPEDSPECAAWTERWPSEAEALDPDIGLFIASSSWQYDVIDANGVVQPFGSAEYWAVLTETLDRELPRLASKRVVIGTPPCSALPDTEFNAPRNDRSRQAALSDFLAAYAAGRGYQVVDLTGPTCSQATEALYVDGLHFDPGAALEVWDWLAPQLVPHSGSETPASPKPAAGDRP